MKINGQFTIPQQILDKIKGIKTQNSLDFIKSDYDPEQNNLIDEIYEIFKDTLKEKGYEVKDYSGRFLYKGPAVYAKDFNEMQDIIKATPCKIQYEELGKKGFMIYPAYTKT